MELTTTERGFDIVIFIDTYGHECSLQKSSLAGYEHIWLGVNNADPQIMASDMRKLGLHTEENNGWVPYPIPKEVLLHTRMHLNREMAGMLAEQLAYFAEHGDLKL